MELNNSPLISCRVPSPNRTSPRSHKIDTVTIHCTAGKVTAESLGKLFGSKSRKASSNYGIGDNGEIALYVDESDRSWCSSNASNDHRAVTIEVSSESRPPYAVSKAAYASLIYLVADICRRNGIDKLRWQNDSSLKDKTDEKGNLLQNLTLHKWFAKKACPGKYLEERIFDIVAKVNSIL